MKKFILTPHVGLMSLLLIFGVISSCSDDPTPAAQDPVASFQFEVGQTNFLQVTFTNFSQNASTYSWDFGDGNNSTDQDPVHTYMQTGTFSVTLTAMSDDGKTSTQNQSVTVTDPDEALALLAGTSSKTWKLFREGTSMQLGPNANNPGGWWPGLTNDGSRNCLYEQTFTFTRANEFIFDDKGKFWGEFGVWPADHANYEVCFDANAANMMLPDGTDLSAWLSGTHSYTYDASTGKVTLTGNGAWMGIPKLGTAAEHGATVVAEVAFNITITQQTGYDHMQLVFDYGDGEAGGGGRWEFNYASYSDASLEPALAGPKARPNFEFSFTEGAKTVTFTNSSLDADTYMWDFGDGNTSTEANPMHTYAADGIYDVMLTAKNSTSEESITKKLFLNVKGITEFTIDHETDVTWNVFGGSAVEIVDNPDKSGINTSNKVLKLTHGHETWAGIITDLGGLLDFTGKTKLKVKLWAPSTGTLKYKIEAAGGSPSQEIDLNVATAQQWIELEWDLSTDLNGNAVESDKYSGLVLFPGWNTTTPDVYYIDDVTMQ